MDLDVLNLCLQLGTLVAGALVTLFPPRSRALKGGALAVILVCGVGGLVVAREASDRADARNAAAQAEIVRLAREGDQRVARVQDRLEDVSERLAAKGIAATPEQDGQASAAFGSGPGE